MDADELKKEGNKAFSNKEYKKAAKLYRDAIRTNPQNPVLYSNRAMCFIKLEDWKRVISDCEKGLLF
ncbi:Tah1p ASCRUDRAFT_39122, partial [Ascoidea rubescens DSM 1968]